MFVSAYWHGLHPGYYLTFLSASAYLFVESQMLNLLMPSVAVSRDHTNNEVRAKRRHQPLTGCIRWISWFLRMRASEYFGIGFELRGLQETMRYWQQLYFVGHVILLISFVGCLALTRWRKNVEKRRRVSDSKDDSLTTQ